MKTQMTKYHNIVRLSQETPPFLKGLEDDWGISKSSWNVIASQDFEVS